MPMIQDSMCPGTSVTDVLQIKACTNALFTSTIMFILHRHERGELEILGVILQYINTANTFI